MTDRDPPTPLRTGRDALQAFLRVHEVGLSRERPYIGQPHTVNGARGQQCLPPITLRDLADVIVATLGTVPDEGEHSWRRWDSMLLASHVCIALEEEFPEHFRWLAEHPFDETPR